MKNILCIAAHPDDETFGCFGTLAKHAQAKDRVHIITITNGDMRGESVKKIRFNAFKKICYMLNASFEYGNFSDCSLETVKRTVIAKIISEAIIKQQPDIIYFIGKDIHYEHTLVNEITRVEIVRYLQQFCLDNFASYEYFIPSNFLLDALQSAKPTIYNVIDLNKKLEALALYNTEVTRQTLTKAASERLHKIFGDQVNAAAAEILNPFMIKQGTIYG